MGLILLRYGELALKGRNRNQFVRRLRENLRACMKVHGLHGDVVSVGQRIYVRTEQVEGALGPLSRVFGLASLSPVAEVARDIDTISAECVRQAQIAGVSGDVSYRVQARRSDKSFPYISPQINRLAAEAIAQSLGGRIDLSRAASVTIGVEVAREAAMIYGRVIQAPGGLPLGIEGRVVALISGGIDSPVAAWMMMKRGCSVIPLHFSQNEAETRKALDNIELLKDYSYGSGLRPIVLDQSTIIGPTLEKLRAVGADRWNCLFCKRALLLKACEIADELDAHAIVMGDALGQVASQTLVNMEVISYGIPKLILRPLVGLDKNEIVTLARRIGTFDISTRSEAGCCFLPAHPVTHGSTQKLQEILQRIEELNETLDRAPDL